MIVAAFFDDDPRAFDEALRQARTLPEHERAALATKLVAIAKRTSAKLAEATDEPPPAPGLTAEFTRACLALSNLRVEVAKMTLLRIADAGTPYVKSLLADALRETVTHEGRTVLLYLLSDDDAYKDAIVAIGAAPWPEALKALIEVAEADDQAARLAATPIAKCGAEAGPNETNAAADFLLEQLDDEPVLAAATLALLRYGDRFPGVAAKGRRLTKEPGIRKLAGLCLVAAFGDEENAPFLELALAGRKVSEGIAQSFLLPLLEDRHPRVRAAAEKTWKALDLQRSSLASIEKR